MRAAYPCRTALEDTLEDRPLVAFGSLLRTHRTQAQLTQSQLADRAGVTTRAVAALELGERSHPYAHTVRALGDSLELAGNARRAFELIASGGPMLDVQVADGLGLSLETEPWLVGRRDHVRHAVAALEAAAAGSGGVVTMTGEPGTGKTVLGLTLARAALLRGFDVGWGTAHSVEKDIPLAPIAEALRGLLDDGAGAYPSKLTAWPEVARLLGYQTNGSGLPRSLPPESVPEAITGTVNQIVLLLSELSSRRPILLVVDDAHVADEATLSAMHLLSRRVSHTSVLLALAYTWGPGAAQESLSQAIQSAAAVSFTMAIELGSLSRRDTAEFLEDKLGSAANPKLIRRIHTLTRGNPRLISRIVRAIQDAGTTGGIPPNADGPGFDWTHFLDGLGVAGG